MVASLTPAKPSTYVKVANLPGLYRHSRSGRYYGCKKLHGVRRERSLETCDRKIAERRLKEWIDNMGRVDTEAEKASLDQLVQRYVAVTSSLSESSRATDQSIIKRFWAWWPHGRDFQVRQVRPSMLDEWLAHEAPRLRNVSYNGYSAFIRQLFDIAVKDRIITVSPASQLRVPWKKPQTVRRIIPTVAQFEAIVASIRSQQYADTAQDSADFIEFLGLAGLGQAEASSLTWGDIDWQRNRIHIRRHKTDTHFYVPIYAHLRPLLVRMKESTRGRVSASARVFKVKDAKKALAAACARLKLPPFSQRSLRQGLIMRLWRAGVDKKLIARWQGHQDGGQLIMDTYTEAFGGDDAEYERGQLAKLDDHAAVAETVAAPPAPGVDEPTSEAMKGPSNHDAHPAGHSAPAVHSAAAAVNPYRKGDKVRTKLGGKGEEVEAEVTAVFNDEVQVRTPDGELRWRTIRTVQPTVELDSPERAGTNAKAAPPHAETQGKEVEAKLNQHVKPHKSRARRERMAEFNSMHDIAAHPLACGLPCALSGQSLLVHADCLDWLVRAEENTISAIVTDPPYGVKEYEAEAIERLQNGNRGGIWRLPPNFDGSERAPLPRFTALSPKERAALIGFFVSWSKAALRVIRPGGHLFVASNSFLSADVFAAIVTAGWEFRGEIIRLVSTLRGGDKPKLHEDEFPTVCSLPRGHYEPWGLFRRALPPRMRAGECLREFGTGGLRFCKDGSQFRDVIASERTPKEERAVADHPSLKPISFMRQLVYASLPLGTGIILDPFAGSGSTVAAAELEGLQAVGIERNEGYYLASLKSVPALVRLRQDLQLHLV